MSVISERLRSLREGLHVSQNKIANMIGTTQATINRYEMGQSFPSEKALLWYADYFDVSLDYILVEQISHKERFIIISLM